MEPITREEILIAAAATGKTPSLTPITREEMFLAKAAGMDVNVPEPITRKEMFLSMITGSGNSGEVVDGLEIVPDFSAGDYEVVAPTGLLVRSAIIKKPKTLVPDNIAEGVEIAGVVGTHVGGGEVEKPFDCHSVTFVYGDKSYVRSVADGDTCADPVERGLIPTPTKESTAQYDFTFYGWGASDGGAADANILKNITADKTVYAIFVETARLFNITFYDDNGTTVLATKQFGYGTIPNYTPTKAGYMFGGWNPEPVPVTGDASYTVVWTTQLASGTSLQTTWRLYTNGTLRISGTGEPQWYNKTGYTGNPLYQYRTQIKEVIIEEGVTGIPSYYFYKDYDAIESITLADSVISLGSYSLYSCGALKSINFPDNLQTIGDYALYACVELTSSIDIPNSVTSIGEKAFMMCKKVASITLGNGVTSLPYYCFAECYALESITIPANITELPDGGFNKCTSLASVTFNGAITKINQLALCNTAITTITIPASVTVIGRSAFYGCPLASAYFENPNGWTVNGTATAATDLADPATAASLLVQDAYWSRS